MDAVLDTIPVPGNQFALLVHAQIHEWLVSRVTMRALGNLPTLPALIIKSEYVAVEALP